MGNNIVTLYVNEKNMYFLWGMHMDRYRKAKLCWIR